MSNLPSAPTAVAISRSGSGAVLVTFTPPEDDGGAPVTKYTVTATPTSGQGTSTSATGQNSPISMSSLFNGTEYTFTVIASNSVGDSDTSTESAALTVGTVPSVPLAVSATRESAQSSVSFNTPSSNGGLPITSYTATAYDTIVESNGGQTATGTGSPLMITGLMNGDAYTFTVVATNDAGSSSPSGSSALVIPGGDTLEEPQAPWPNALSFTVTKRIGALQFQAELNEATHQSCQVSVTNDTPLSMDGIVWIIPNTVDSAVVQTVIANHVMDPNYGVPSYVAAFNAVLTKVHETPNEDLSDEEIQVALKGVLSRISNGN